MKTPFYQIWISLVISVFLLSPSMIKAKSVSPEPSAVSKNTTTAPRPFHQPNVKRPKPGTQKPVPTVKIQSGYCCVDGKVIKDNELNCKRKRGQFSLDQRSAQKTCDARSGYCCEGGKVSRSKQATCKRNRGDFYVKQTDAKKKCAGTKGFCCNKSKVSTTLKSRCEQNSGNFFIKKTDAENLCAMQNGYCCVDGKVSRMNQKTCKKKKGHFASNQQLATRACKTEKGFCCANGKVNPSSRGLCEQKRGRFSTSRQKKSTDCTNTTSNNMRKSSVLIPATAKRKPVTAPPSLALSVGSAGKNIVQGGGIGSDTPYKLTHGKGEVQSVELNTNGGQGLRSSADTDIMPLQDLTRLEKFENGNGYHMPWGEDYDPAASSAQPTGSNDEPEDIEEWCTNHNPPPPEPESPLWTGPDYTQNIIITQPGLIRVDGENFPTLSNTKMVEGKIRKNTEHPSGAILKRIDLMTYTWNKSQGGENFYDGDNSPQDDEAIDIRFQIVTRTKELALEKAKERNPCALYNDSFFIEIPAVVETRYCYLLEENQTVDVQVDGFMDFSVEENWSVDCGEFPWTPNYNNIPVNVIFHKKVTESP